MVTVSIDNLSPGQQATCEECSAKGKDFRSQIWFPYCRLAKLENGFRKIPTYEMAAVEGINTTIIPENCPNGYISSGNREVR